MSSSSKTIEKTRRKRRPRIVTRKEEEEKVSREPGNDKVARAWQEEGWTRRCERNLRHARLPSIRETSEFDELVLE